MRSSSPEFTAGPPRSIVRSTQTPRSAAFRALPAARPAPCATPAGS
jgi:hypothetical protein